MKCQKCGFDLDNSSTFCPYCGEKVEKEVETLCKNCGAQLQIGDKFCQSCGSATGLEQGNLKTELTEEEQLVEKRKKTVNDIKNNLSSTLSLIIVIMTIVTLVLNFIASLISGGIFEALINAIIPTLTAIGIWKTYMYGKNSKAYPKTGLNLVYLSSQITFVLFCIVAVLFTVVFSGACTCGTIVNPSIGIALILPLMVMFGIFGFFVFYYWRQLKFIQDLTITIEAGTNSYKKHFKLIYVVQLIMVILAGIGILSLIPLIGSADLMYEMLEEMLDELDLENQISININSIVGIGYMSILASLSSFATQILYLVGLKKFDSHYQELE